MSAKGDQKDWHGSPPCSLVSLKRKPSALSLLPAWPVVLPILGKPLLDQLLGLRLCAAGQRGDVLDPCSIAARAAHQGFKLAHLGLWLKMGDGA